MSKRVGRETRRRTEVERLRRLLVRLCFEDRPAFDALVRLVYPTARAVRARTGTSKKVYKT